MYQLEHTDKGWDTDFFHTLMGEKRIVSSKAAKQIRTRLHDAGALPPFDGHYDWAMLCIGYCLARGFADSTGRLTPAPDTQGTEIVSFQTCFQSHSRLWLVMLSDILFHLHPGKAVTKDDLYTLIQNLWHTGAVELEKSWEKCKQFKPDDELAARQTFLNELTDLAVKNSGMGSITDGQARERPSENQEQRLRGAFIRQNISVAELKFSHAGARYDIYRLRLSKYADLDRYRQGLCSELGVKESALHIVPCYNNESHAYDVKLLRDEKAWHKLGAAKFAEALQSYNKDYVLPVCIGIDEYGKAHFKDLASAPHLLIGGTTGSGKSVFVRTLLRSLFDLCKGQDKMEVAVLDPKKVDYRIFENEEDLYEERILDDYSEIYQFLLESVEESERRYALMSQHRVEKLARLPDSVRPRYRVIVVDELANLLKHHDGIEKQLMMLAEKARASGIHLILSTQRPDARVLDGTLRSNLPARIAFSVQKSTESKIILDETGAENLIGKGDHLVKWDNGTPYFLHGFDV
ncbi:FtsK/SpoIIIE domain-containing protein [Neisseria leonii]|uniref:FtsK/SpoIIIE domain-containing protein n=1 Tax=Neisseria leonii TaxID=2995413 RepID=A0A9X4IDP5_9NEIS|nr:FtsK/SpoIIIE domain-containing protein [Neisseria sp. 51.81]MDD9327911.1 FtsK/SpoIIIE domain-containing protein [Neisseria sp. 51.81]